MKIVRLLLLFLLLGSLIFPRTPVFSQGPSERKIIVFKPEVTQEERNTLLSRHQAIFGKELRLINGTAVSLPQFLAEKLAQDPKVLRVDPDVEVYALARTQAIAEVLPWGIDRIDAEKIWNVTTGDRIKVAVIDTGIDTLHPDLTRNIAGGVSTVGYTRRYTDDNGHGTHVAGIIGAIDNEIGVIGVGPKISLYAVKVLDRRGSGYLSDVIEGLDWAIVNKMQVVNMSLGTSSNVQSFEEAVQRVNQAGIVQVVAAGNSGPGENTVLYPARYSEVIAVSATDQGNNITSWSSAGPEIDLAAPGTSIYSTYKGRSYATMSGTSMAAPHVAGTAALLLSVPDKCDSNSDGSCSPDEVQQRLERTATELGTPGKDVFYGAGLVNAYQAITAAW